MIALAVLLPLLCAGSGPDEPLEPDQAFEFSARAVGPAEVEARWRIADGCYLYHDRIRFTVEGARLHAPRFPPAELHQDPFVGTAEIYRGEAMVVLPISAKDGVHSVRVRAEFQGCDGNRGICYPPTSRSVTVDLPPHQIPREGARP